MSESEKSQAIVVVDPDSTSRSAAEDLEDDLEVEVLAMDSTMFTPDASEDVARARVFIICWDLGIRSGADLLEEIRNDESLASRIVLIATTSPTPALVRAALALGADGVCRKPYDAEEIKTRLAAIEARSAEQAA